MKQKRLLCLAGAALILPIGSPLLAANRIYVQNQVLKVGDTGMSVPVLADTDQERHGFSLSIKYDQTKLKVNSVDVAGTASDGAGWSAGRIVADQGAITWSVVLGLNTADQQNPFNATKVIPVGTGRVLVNLKVDVLAAAATSTSIVPQDGLGTPTGGWANSLVYRSTAVRPPGLVLAGGTITIDPRAVVGTRFKRGDADGDGEINLTDPIYILANQFQGGPDPDCMDAADVDDQGDYNLTDAIFSLQWQFLAGKEPPKPGPFACGIEDSTEDPFTNCTYPQCPQG